MFDVTIKGRSLHFKFPVTTTPSRRDFTQNVPCTICDVHESHSDVFIGIGMALCSPKDNFDKNHGRKLALTNFVESQDFTHEERVKIWEAYRDARNGKME